ncbi:MAG TPA: hypothetical protein DCQ83_01295 [Fibrobacteres bacterium]|jgi:lipopolysaccharide biosynthesis regulator YciM|nr:hypothetical protein [Fibrobacterota bacterium]
MKAFWILALAGGLLACGPNCRETAQLADFEFSQRNYERAIKLYEQAWAKDSTGCPEVKAKLEQTREFLKPSGR